MLNLRSKHLNDKHYIFFAGAFTFFFYGCLAFLKYVPTGDTFQWAANQYVFLNEMITNHVLPKWMPFMTHGTIANIWFSASVSWSSALLLFLGSLFKINYFYLYYLALIIEELIFLAGVYLCAKLFYKDPLTRAFVVVSAIATSILTEQIHFALKFYQLMPFILYSLILFFRDKKLYRLIVVFCLILCSLMGTLPYFLPVIFAYFVFLFAYLYFSTKKIKIDPTPRYSLIAGVFLVLLASYVYISNKVGIDELSFFNYGRDGQGKVTIGHFIGYAGLHSPFRFSELFTGMSLNFELQFFPGFLTMLLSFLTLAYLPKLLKNKEYVLVLSLTVFTFLFTQGTFVSRIAYYTLPYMSYFRHLAFVCVFLKLFLCFLAGFGFEILLDKKKLVLKDWLALSVPWLLSVFLISADAYSLLVKGHSVIIKNYVINKLLTIPPTLDKVSQAAMVNIEFVYLALLVAMVVVLITFKGRKSCVALLMVGFASLVVYKWQFSVWSSQKGTDEMIQTFAFTSYPFSEQRVQNYLTNPRYAAWHPYLYSPQHVPNFTKKRPEDGFSFEASNLVGPNGALYWSNESFFFLDSCFTIYRVDHVVKYLRSYFKQHGHYQIDDLRRWQPAYITEQFLNNSGCFRSKIQTLPRAKIGHEVLDFNANTLKVKMQGPASYTGLLYYADAWHSFWTATVDGVSTPVERANTGYKAVAIRGNSIVEFKFANRLLDFMMIVQLGLSLAGLFIGFWIFRRVGSNKPI